MTETERHQFNLDTALEAFKAYVKHEYEGYPPLPSFDRGYEYFISKKHNEWEELITELWDGFWAGWQARDQFTHKKKGGGGQ